MASSSPADARPHYQGPEYLEAIGPAAQPRALDPLLHPDPYRPPMLFVVGVTLIRWLSRTLFRFRVRGLANVPQPPFIIASNHQAWFDILFLLAAFPTRPMIYTMARRDTVFNTAFKRWLVPKFGVFPIAPNQGELDADGVASTYQVLARRGVVLIFPEGRYSRGEALLPLKKGVAHFALEAGVPICPVAISGLDRLRPLGRVGISIGPPIRPDSPRWWAKHLRVSGVVEAVREAILRAFGPSAEQDGGRRLRRLLGRLRPAR